MAAELVGGALLGAVVGETLKALLEAKNLLMEFGICYLRLKTTLEAIQSRLMELESENLNDNLKHNMKNMLMLLNEGKELIRKSSNLSKWKSFMRPWYSKKMLRLEENLCKYASSVLEIDIWVDVQLIKKEMVVIQETLSHLSIEGVQRCGTANLFAAGIVPKLPSLVLGLGVPLEELKSKLIYANGTVIGVCCPGGCGKTTLVSKLCKDTDVIGRFKQIIFLTVSSSPNMLEILKTLRSQLVNGEVPEVVTVDDTVMQLPVNQKKRKKLPVLLILDDLWEESVLEDLVFREPNIVTVVTSRIKFRLFDDVYSVARLSEDDALALFSHYAITKDRSTEQPDDRLVRAIVKECKGLPLAIKVIGSSLKHEPQRKWQNTLDKLKEGKPIYDVHEQLLNCLSKGLLTLYEEVRECFLDLGAFPKGEKISAAALMDIWVEHRDFTEDEAYVALLDLSVRNLIGLLERTSMEAGDEDGTLNDLYVIQHDLLRDLAVHLSKQESIVTEKTRLMMNWREDSLPKAWNALSTHASKAKLVSMHTGEMGEASWIHMILPEVEVLILNFSASTYFLPTFLEGMKNLRVLIIHNHSSKPAQLSGAVPWESLKNLKRVRLEKLSLPTQLTLEGPLRGVEKLALVSCTVSSTSSCSNPCIPNVFPMLKELDINYCNQLDKIPEEVCEVTSLEKLSITNCPDFSELPSKIGNSRKLQVLRLQACTALEKLPESIINLENLTQLDMSHCSSIEMLPDGFGELGKLKKFDMRKCLGLHRLPSSVKHMNSLMHVVCDEDTTRLWKPLQHELQMLEIIVPKEKVDLDWLA